jgi:class 3 adenylate cyclase
MAETGRRTSPRPIGQRRLAAIVFTDVVSFSARAQANEALTLRLVKRDFEAISLICAAHEGQVLKTTGDGLLMSFPTAAAAVQCARRIQETMAHNARVLPPEQVLEHRIGIHLGDVFITEQDVMGNDVNIAARVLSEAGGGEICISQTVYDVVKHRLSINAVHLGARSLKNIAEPVSIYKIPSGEAPTRASHSSAPLMATTMFLLVAAGAGAWYWWHFIHAGQLAHATPVHPVATLPATTRATSRATARFMTFDMVHGGDWKGHYGGLAALIVGDGIEIKPEHPVRFPLKDAGGANAEITFVNCQYQQPMPRYTETTLKNADQRNHDEKIANPAPQRVGSSGRVVAGFIGADTFRIRIHLPDQKHRRLALYAWEWSGTARSEAVVVRDTATDELLESRALTRFADGHYINFDISGDVTVDIRREQGANAMISGVFLDPMP